MSAIASFFLLNTSKLDELRTVKDTLWEYLNGNAKALKDFTGSGFMYGIIPSFLKDEKDIDLLQNEYKNLSAELDEKGGSHLFFTNTQRIRFNHLLKPGNFTLEELQKFTQAFFGDDEDEETTGLIPDAINVLHDNLNEVKNDNEVLLLIVS